MKDFVNKFLIGIVRERIISPVVVPVFTPIFLLFFNGINYLFCLRNKTPFKSYWGGTIELPPGWEKK